jgi:hypothetical protein
MYIALVDHWRNEPRIGSMFSQIAIEFGREIRAYDDTSGGLEDFLTAAEAFICVNDHFIRDENVAEIVHGQLAAGKRLLARLGENSLDGLNSFLKRYHIEGTRMRLAAANGAGVEHPRLVAVDRELNPESFRDDPLLEGVTRLVVALPNLIRYGGDARPLVLLPTSELQVVNAASDLRVQWASSEATCIVCFEPSPGQVTVVAFAGDITNDPYTGPTGFRWPGIKAGDNAQFARMLVAWLSGA